MPVGTQYLDVGEVWKIGETIQYSPASGQQWRYSQSYLKSLNVSFVPEYVGMKTDIIFAQQMKLVDYVFGNGNLPPGNKGLK